MHLLSARTIRIEAAVIAVASLSVTALASILVRDALSQTEGAFRSAAWQEVTDAAEELRTQYEERAAFSERPLQSLPPEAQDLSLRGLSQTVLRSHKDVQGGFYNPETQSVMGASSEEAALHQDELQTILIAVSALQSARTDAAAEHQSGGDLLVAHALPTSDNRYAWALKRLVGVRDPAPSRRRWLLAGLVLAAVAGVAGVVSILIRLRRGIYGVKQMLQQLESDFGYRGVPATGDFGEIYAAIGKMADRRMELETTLRRQDRLAALGQVVAGVAHEIRNPLNSIRLQLELLKRRARKGNVSGSEIDAAMGQVDRLNTILSQLLGFGKPDVSNRATQPLAPLAHRAVAVVRDRARAKSVQLEITAPDNPEANVDAVQLEQVMTNLLLNAIDVSPENGRVDIDITQSAKAVTIAVADGGPGIAESIRDHIFDAFFTTRPEGTGLGLSVSQQIVTAHGGTVSFETSSNGTTFYVRLPHGKSE